jgi:mono/diheme cytochrome c family protein
MSARFSRAGSMMLMLAAGVAARAFGDDSGFTSATGTDMSSGAQVYAQVCQGCHMPAGQGAGGAGHYPKLASNPAMVSWQYVALTVLNGKNGMPAFGRRGGEEVPFVAVHLSDAQICNVVNYVRSHFGNKWQGNVTASQVAALPHADGIAEE